MINPPDARHEIPIDNTTRVDQIRKTAKTVFKIGIVLFSTMYLLLIISGYINLDRKFGLSEYALIAFTVLFAADFFDKLAEMSFGKEGFTLRLKEVENRQTNLEDVLSAIQVAVKGVISKWEYKHLLNLESPGAYSCHFRYDMFDQIRRLDEFNFIRPVRENSAGFIALKNEHETDQNEFNLKDYMELTDEGRAYLQIRRTLNIEDYKASRPANVGGE